MRVKRVKIGIKSVEDSLSEAKNTMEKLERGERTTKEIGVYFTSLEAFRKVLTPKRQELLHTIRIARPKSIHELAQLTKRNIKNVSDDLKYLEQVGLVERREVRKTIRPSINYDTISLEIAI